MSTLADYYDLLLPELPSCTTAMVDLHLRETAREFCLKTGAWRLQFTDVNLVASQAAYALIVPVADSEVVRLTKLIVNAELLWQDADIDGRNIATSKYARNSPPFELSADLTQITLTDCEVPTVAITAGLQVVGAIKPTATATTLPDFLKTEYSDAIRCGVLSRLMLMGKKPWGDRPLATEYANKWREQLNFAAYQSQVGNTRQQLRVKKWG